MYNLLNKVKTILYNNFNIVLLNFAVSEVKEIKRHLKAMFFCIHLSLKRNIWLRKQDNEDSK